MKRLQVRVKTYFQTEYAGRTDAFADDSFVVESKNLFSPWVFVSGEFTCFEPGDIFDLFRLKEGSYEVELNHHFYSIEAHTL